LKTIDVSYSDKDSIWRSLHLPEFSQCRLHILGLTQSSDDKIVFL